MPLKSGIQGERSFELKKVVVPDEMIAVLKEIFGTRLGIRIFVSNGNPSYQIWVDGGPYSDRTYYFRPNQSSEEYFSREVKEFYLTAVDEGNPLATGVDLQTLIRHMVAHLDRIGGEIVAALAELE